MIDRRHLSLLLLGGAASLSACASDGGSGGPGAADEPVMLFISPMGEPFRAKPPAPYPVDVWFKGADKNGDGKLDLDEFLADADRFFHVLDVNHDGVIDHREVYYYEHVTCPEIIGVQFGALHRRWRMTEDQPRLWLAQFGSSSPGGIGGPGGPPVSDSPPVVVTTPDGSKPLVGAAMYNLLQDPEPVQGADIRLTGKISLSDFRTRAQQRFKVLDEDGKGYLTLAGLPQTQAAQYAPKPRGGRGRSPRRA